MDYIIGIDGGGTKTQITAYDLNGRVITKNLTGACNIITNKQRTMNNLVFLIDEVVRSLNKQKCLCMCIGLAGLSDVRTSDELKTILSKKYETSIIAVSDVDLIVAEVLKNNNGIVTISGTGSASCGIYNGKKFNAGGWGYLLGDEGSGYKIAIDAIKLLINEIDNEKNHSLLTETLLSKINEESNGICKFVQDTDPSEIANLSLLIDDASNKGDTSAKQILIRAANDLAIITKQVYNKMGISEGITLGMAGSVLTKNKTVQTEYIELVKKLLPIKEIISSVEPTKGAYYIAIKFLEKKEVN